MFKSKRSDEHEALLAEVSRLSAKVDTLTEMVRDGLGLVDTVNTTDNAHSRAAYCDSTFGSPAGLTRRFLKTG